MNEAKQPVSCNCAVCPGKSCTCGCRHPAAAACGCAANCSCGKACACAKSWWRTRPAARAAGPLNR